MVEPGMSNASKAILVYDAVEPGLLGKSWSTGAALFRGSFDEVVAAKSVDDLYAVLRRHPKSSLRHVQVWGHGASGAPLINKQPILPTNPSWDAVEGGTVWFRACSVMSGFDGGVFAEAFAHRRIDVAGHLGVIGTWAMQSYLVGLLHEEKTAWWPASVKAGDSAPWKPRTVSALTMRIPEWAFNPTLLK